MGVHPYPSATPPHTAIFSLSRLYWLASIPRIKNTPRIPWKMDTELKSAKVSWQVVWKGNCTLTAFLKFLSNFLMFMSKTLQSAAWRRSWGTGLGHSQAKLLLKNPRRAFTTTPCLAPILPITNESGIPFWRVARGGCSVVRGRPSRKRGKQTNKDPLYFPSPFKPARGALGCFSFLSRLVTL